LGVGLGSTIRGVRGECLLFDTRLGRKARGGEAEGGGKRKQNGGGF